MLKWLAPELFRYMASKPMRYLPVLLLLICASAACQQEWRSSNNSETIPNGKLYTLTYAAPDDSGRVAIAVIEADSTVSCGARSNRNRFPPRSVFDLSVWCEGSEGRINFRYDGEAETVTYNATKYDVSESPLLVGIMRPSGPLLYHLPEDTEQIALPASTEQVLRERYPQAF